MKVTIDVDPVVWQAVSAAASRLHRTIDAVIGEAVAAWVDIAETEEDVDVARTSLAEYEHDGGASAPAAFESMGLDSESAPESRSP